MKSAVSVDPIKIKETRQNKRVREEASDNLPIPKKIKKAPKAEPGDLPVNVNVSQPEPVLFSTGTRSRVHASLKSVVDPAIKRSEFFNFLSKKTENPLDYEIAETAILASQHAYNLRNHASAFSKSYGRAIRLYDQVMDHKIEAKKAQAAYDLGVLYRDGDAHLLQDNNQYIAWYTISAILGNAQAQFELAELYEVSGHSNEIPDDLMRALKWYQKASEQSYKGSVEAYSRLFQETGEILVDAIEELEAQVVGVVARLTNARRLSSVSQISSELRSDDALVYGV